MEDPEHGRGCDGDKVDRGQEYREEENEAVQRTAAPGGLGLTAVPALVRLL